MFKSQPEVPPAHQEVFLEYPDEQVPHHAPRAGDVRSATTPFLAHDHFVKTSQDYKWMLYGESTGLVGQLGT